MPVGPQHRSGGSSRSSSGFGGSRSSRSYSGGRSVLVYSNTSYGDNKPTDPQLLESHNKKAKTIPFFGITLFFLIIIMVALIVCSSIKRESVEKVQIMDDDAVFYETLLNDPTAVRKEAQVKWGKYYMTYKGVDYYYVEYMIFDFDHDLEGETYAQYTSADVNAMGKKIDIVFYEDSGYSINADWKKENAEYLYTKDKAASYSTAVTVLICIESAMAILFVLALVNMIKVNKAEDKKIKAILETRQKEKAEELDKEKNGKKCAYCGTRIKDEQQKCPSCGASVK